MRNLKRSGSKQRRYQVENPVDRTLTHSHRPLHPSIESE